MYCTVHYYRISVLLCTGCPQLTSFFLFYFQPCVCPRALGLGGDGQVTSEPSRSRGPGSPRAHACRCVCVWGGVESERHGGAGHQRLVKGTTNASTLMEKITPRLYNSVYWNGAARSHRRRWLTVPSSLPTGRHVRGNRKPTPFLCLVLASSDETGPVHRARVHPAGGFQVARALGMYYWRLTARPGGVPGARADNSSASARRGRLGVVRCRHIRREPAQSFTLLRHCPAKHTRAARRAGTLVGPRRSALQRVRSVAPRGHRLEHPEVGTTTSGRSKAQAGCQCARLDLL